ncbi:DUF4878 domain-containing protein [Anaerotalea alkaliphila]|uniref:DUF4878 domain-containing protein n=1 Tax=Anaerotalea alkaliphila TaxID=2662126 RepID=A0A7X5HVR5_9FIRM|nr:DUF4878 domain-containing protein [Anaerotalea alkaliphila]NDL67540.1 DUF4878 domain-containing protein [Anaerotalea alkaliphila]
MKKISALVLAFIMVAGLTGCGLFGVRAEDAAKEFLEAVKAADKEAISKYVSYEELMEISDEEAADEEDATQSEEFIKLMLNGMTYAILESKEDGAEATVKVEITNIDMKNVMGEYIKEAFGLAFANAFSEEMDEEAMEKELTDMLVRMMEENKDKTVTNTVDMKMKKVDKQWKVDADEELQNAILGDLAKVVEDFADWGEDETAGLQ